MVIKIALGTALMLALCTHTHAFLAPAPAASRLPSAVLSLRRPGSGKAGGMKMGRRASGKREDSICLPPNLDRRGVVGGVMLPVGLGALLQVRARLGGWMLVGLVFFFQRKEVSSAHIRWRPCAIHALHNHQP